MSSMQPKQNSWRPSKAYLAAEIRRAALEYAVRLGCVGPEHMVRAAAIIEAYLTKGTVPKAKK